MSLRQKYRDWYDIEVDPERQICITCGANSAKSSDGEIRGWRCG
jgi:hypothetical protein